MKKDKQIQMKYIKPKSVNKILMRFRDKIGELLSRKNDRGFWHDFNKHYAERNTPFINKSNLQQDKNYVMEQDLEKVAIELIQIALFGRILQTDDEDNIINMPENSLPYFMKQTIGKYEKDLYDINSQAVFMNIYEKNTAKKKNKNLNMIRKVVSHNRRKVK